MKMKNYKKIIAEIVCIVTLSIILFGTVNVQAASLKTTANKKISSTVDKQYSKIKSYGSKWKYTIVRDKKEGKLITAVDKKSCYKTWNIRLKNPKSKAFLAIKFENTYAKKTKKVSTKIYLSLFKGKYKGTQIGHIEEIGSLTEMKQLMKQFHTKSGFEQYIKQLKEVEEDGQEVAPAGMVRVYRCLACKYFSTSYVGAYIHQLFIHRKRLTVSYVDAKWVR